MNDGGATDFLKKRERIRHKTVGNVSDEATGKQEDVVGGGEREGGAGGGGQARGWGDVVEDGMPSQGWQERLAAAMRGVHQRAGGGHARGDGGLQDEAMGTAKHEQAGGQAHGDGGHDDAGGELVAEDAGDGEGEAGVRTMVRKTDPKAPTAEERKEHELTHLPFRSWCRHCIRGRGKEESCPRKVRDENDIPEVHLDYMFMGGRTGGANLSSPGGTREGFQSDPRHGGTT